ncbi:MAG: transcription antitermination factor NusB [Lachnospiraceae bacterium]|nr:transcription antitermination factor NusB [Lachnospiraceae bacterium]
MTRRELRKHLVRLLYLKEFHEADDIEEQNQLYFDVLLPNEGINIDEDGKENLIQVYGKIVNLLPEIDQILSSEMLKWNIKRIGIVERNILRLSTYEIRYEQLPEPVVINEAVELAKEFAGEQSPGFINGVLAQIVKKRS